LEAAASQLAANEHVSGIEDCLIDGSTVNFIEPDVGVGAVVSFDIAHKFAVPVDAVEAFLESVETGSMFAII
jgi:hypothetical protein